MKVTPESFKQTMRRFASGVTVVTIQDQDKVQGITVSAFISVSLEPPLALVSIAKKASIHPKMLNVSHYGVSILSQPQDRVSNHFAGWDKDVAPNYTVLDDHPVIDGALCQLVCRTVDRHDAGDHTLFVGQLEALAWHEGEPLVYFNGQYRNLSSLAPSA